MISSNTLINTPYGTNLITSHSTISHILYFFGKADRGSSFSFLLDRDILPFSRPITFTLTLSPIFHSLSILFTCPYVISDICTSHSTVPPIVTNNP